MPFLAKPLPGAQRIRDRTGRLRACPPDYGLRRTLLRRAKRGNRQAARRLWETYGVTVWIP